MQRAFVAIACLSLLTGCASSALLRGQYVYGHEVESFTPCGSNESFWLVGSQPALQQLRDQAIAASRIAPYTPIYVEISAHKEPDATDGFAADYSGVYRVQRIHVTSKVSPDRCGAHG